MFFNFKIVGEQVCPSGNITLSSQIQIDNFATDYPGCTQILGDLTIQESTTFEITSLAGLNQISTINGTLKIADNDALINFNGFDNLISIGELLIIEDNDMLLSIAQLSNLCWLDNSLWVFNNSSLNSLSGLENLNLIGGYLWIQENPNLIDLTGLDNITAIDDGLSINANNGLISLMGLDNLVLLNGDCRVYNNSLLSNIIALANVDLTTVTNLRFYSNPNLSICGLPNVCNYIEAGMPAEIHDNDINCNTTNEILNNCIVLCSSLPSILQVNELIIAGANYQALDVLSSSGGITDGTDVNFIAGLEIVLQNDFNVSANTAFSAEISICEN